MIASAVPYQGWDKVTDSWVLVYSSKPWHRPVAFVSFLDCNQQINSCYNNQALLSLYQDNAKAPQKLLPKLMKFYWLGKPVVAIIKAQEIWKTIESSTCRASNKCIWELLFSYLCLLIPVEKYTWVSLTHAENILAWGHEQNHMAEEQYSMYFFIKSNSLSQNFQHQHILLTLTICVIPPLINEETKSIT